MNALVFDTHGFIKSLTEAGMPEQQAEILAVGQTNLIENNLATKQDIKALEVVVKELEVALKSDIKELEAATKRDIKELEAKMQHGFKDLEQRLTIRLGGMLVTGIAVVAALVKLL